MRVFKFLCRLIILLAIVNSPVFSQPEDVSTKTIKIDSVGQREIIKKGEKYKLVYGKADPENTRIRYLQSRNDNEYVLEVVYYEDLVKAKDPDREKPDLSQKEQQALARKNDSLKSELEQARKNIEWNTDYLSIFDRTGSEDNPSAKITTPGYFNIFSLNKLQEKIDSNTDEAKEVSAKIESNEQEYKRNEANIESIKERIKYLKSQGGFDEEIDDLQGELEELINRNELLKRENQVLSIDKTSLMKDVGIKQLQLENQKRLRNFFIILAAMVSFTAFVLFVNFRTKKKANQELESMNENLTKKNIEITEAHNQITDSIYYAMRIQQAALPYQERIETYLKEYFIFFKPKSIVSGDFYWIEQVEGYTFAAVIDCTGHGVPGAFMSIIGNDLLNQIIKDNKIYSPAKILEELHLGVRRALQQKDKISEPHDGMEICLVRIKDDELLFAGAKRPLWYVRNGSFEEIKGSRRPIGGRQKESVRTFENHNIEIREELTLYLTSDGFADQNDPANENYGISRLKRTLKSISRLNMSEQRKAMKKELEEFAMGEPNRDDITILGIKLK